MRLARGTNGHLSNRGGSAIENVAKSQRWGKASASSAPRSDGAAGRFLAGEKETVNAVVRAVRYAVSRRGFFIPVQERAEVEQEAVVDLVLALSKPAANELRSIEALARSIAYRRCVDWVRRNRVTEAIDDLPPEEEKAPEDELLGRERMRMAGLILRRLSPSCLQLMRRHTCEGETFRKIAAEQGRLEKTVRNQMSRCLAHARRLLLDLRRRERLGLTLDRRDS